MVRMPMPAALKRVAKVLWLGARHRQGQSVSCCEPLVELHDWTRPSVPLTHEAERIVGVANEQLAGCRRSETVLEDFSAFVGHPKAG
jgi:hypothetical protein